MIEQVNGFITPMKGWDAPEEFIKVMDMMLKRMIKK